MYQPQYKARFRLIQDLILVWNSIFTESSYFIHMQKQVKRCFILLMALFAVQFVSAQLPYGLIDGRNADLRCESCEKLIEEKPVEVLFGVDIHENGDVYFSMNNT
jgi:hypothetical protein